MKRKLVTILIGCMTLGLFGCGSGLSDTTKRLTPQQSEDSEQNADHTGNEDQQTEADTTEKKAEDGSIEHINISKYLDSLPDGETGSKYSKPCRKQWLQSS